MKKPICKLCSEPHWPREPHILKGKSSVEASEPLIRGVSERPKPSNVTPSDHNVTLEDRLTELERRIEALESGRKKNAERQRAYRERKRGE